MLFLTSDASIQAEPHQPDFQSQQNALRRTRWYLAIASIAFLITLIVALYGWLNWRHHTTEDIQRLQSTLNTYEMTLKQRNAVITELSAQFDQVHDHLVQSITTMQDVLALFTATYQTEQEQTLETAIAALEQDIQIVNAQLERDARQNRLNNQNQSQSRVAYDDAVTQERSLQEAKAAFAKFIQDAWKNGATVVQLKSQEQLFKFRRDQLKTFERDTAENDDMQTLLDEITVATYNVLSVVGALPVTPATFANNRSEYVTRFTSINQLPRNFKEGSTPSDIQDQLYNLKRTAQEMEQATQKTFTMIYEAGQDAERNAIESELTSKERELAALREQATQLQQKLTALKSGKAHTLRKLETQRDAAIQAYMQADKTLTAAQVMLSPALIGLAEEAFQHKQYEIAIRHTLQAIIYTPEKLSAYTPLILALQRIRQNQSALSSALLDGLSQEVLALSESWRTDGTFRKLEREIQTYWVRVYYELACCFLASGNKQNALNIIEHAIAIAALIPDNDKNIGTLRNLRQDLQKSM